MVLDERCVDLVVSCVQSCGLTFKAPISFTIRAHLRPWSLDLRMLERSVVLPDPRKPDRSVTGRRLSFSPVGMVMVVDGL